MDFDERDSIRAGWYLFCHRASYESFDNRDGNHCDPPTLFFLPSVCLSPPKSSSLSMELAHSTTDRSVDAIELVFVDGSKGIRVGKSANDRTGTEKITGSSVTDLGFRSSFCIYVSIEKFVINDSDFVSYSCQSN